MEGRRTTSAESQNGEKQRLSSFRATLVSVDTAHETDHV